VVRGAGFAAQGAFSGRACIEKAGIFPIKDIIVLDYVLNDEGDITVEEVYRRLKRQAHTATMPILFTVPDTMVAEVPAKFPDAPFFVTKPINRVDFINALKKIATEKVSESVIREQINTFARDAAETLAGINVNATHINLKGAVKELIAAFNSRIDEVRIGAMMTVANLKAAEAIESLKEVFKNGDNSSAVRIASLQAIGVIDPAGAQDLLTEAVGDEDMEISKAAAIALGKKDFPASVINKLMRKTIGH
jgi:HEAT repeat protein